MLKFVISIVAVAVATLIPCQSSLRRGKRLVSHETEGDEFRPRVFLTVSSLASEIVNGKFEERRLELNWYNALPPGLNESESSWIALFDHDPVDNFSDPLVSVFPKYHPNNFYRTSVQFPRLTFTVHNLTENCLGFWIAYVYQNKILSSTCLRIRPHWMHDMRHIIGNVSLLDLMIPGTHNSGSYAPFHPDTDTIFYRYLINQEEDIWNQLIYGIRYLDLRVSYQRVSGTKEKLWITHDMFPTEISVKDVISQVKTFIQNTNEIVIMDFHRFANGFSGRKARKRHMELINLLHSELGEFMIPTHMTTWATLNDFWRVNRTLYVGYASNGDRRESDYLFPAVRHLWGNVDKLDELHEYLNSTVCLRRSRLSSAMAELTAPVYGAIFDIFGGLRKMADEVNRHVTRWFRELWWPCGNIVATDYFLGNDIVDVAIQTNKRKFGA